MITDIAVCRNGFQYYTTAKSFFLIIPEKVKTSSVTKQETDVKLYHQSRVVSICISKNQDLDKKPSKCVFISSADNITSWIWSTEDKCYQIASQCPVKSTNLAVKPTQSSLSCCQSALGIAKANFIHILSVASNFGLSTWATIQPSSITNNLNTFTRITCLTFLSSLCYTDDMILLLSSSENGLFHIWNVRDCNCIFLGNLSTKSSPCRFALCVGFCALPSPRKWGERENIDFTNIALIGFGTDDSKLLLFGLRKGSPTKQKKKNINPFHCYLLNEIDLKINTVPIFLDFIEDLAPMVFPYCAIASQSITFLVDCSSGNLLKTKNMINKSQSNVMISKACIKYPFVLLKPSFLPSLFLESIHTESIQSNFPQVLASKYKDQDESIQYPVLCLSPEQNYDQQFFKGESVNLLSELNDENLPPDSPLLSIFSKTSGSSCALNSSKQIAKMKSRSIQKRLSSSPIFSKNQLTNVKSSGYATINPKISLGQTPSSALKAEKLKSTLRKQKFHEREMKRSKAKYPMNCNLIASHQPEHDDEGRSTLPPISSVQFNPNATYLATAHYDCSMHIFKLPFSKYGSPSKQILSCVKIQGNRQRSEKSTLSWSSSGTLIAFGNSIYCVSKSNKRSTQLSSSLPKCLDLPISHRDPQFFYKDKFLLTVSASTLFLNRLPDFNTSMDCINNEVHNNNQKREKGNCHPHIGMKSRTAYTWLHGTAQNITSIDAISNTQAHMYSYLIAVATSDKKLYIHDASTGKNVWSVPNCAGVRAAHSIAFPRIVSHSGESDCSDRNVSIPVLAAASVDGGGLISLWDIRTASSAGHLRGHVNKRECCRTSFSPCMRYVAVGSEGRNAACAVFYDLRKMGCSSAENVERYGIDSKNGIVASLGGKGSYGSKSKYLIGNGSIIDVKYNPIFPQVVTASLDGSLRFYKENKNET